MALASSQARRNDYCAKAPAMAAVDSGFSGPFGAPTRPTSAPAKPPFASAQPDTALINLDARLDAVRRELAKLHDEKWTPPKNRTPAGTPPTAGNPYVNPDPVLLYMSRFEPRRLRNAPASSRRLVRRNPALGSVQSDFMAGQHPIGYRPLSGRVSSKSSPAYTFRKKMVLSRDVDPYAADDTPGPGAYHTADF